MDHETALLIAWLVLTPGACLWILWGERILGSRP